jgi:hypothetical protein
MRLLLQNEIETGAELGEEGTSHTLFRKNHGVGGVSIRILGPNAHLI